MVDMLLEVVGPLVAGMLLGALVFVSLYQEQFHYQCVENDDELIDDFDEDWLREMESAEEGKTCYAAPLED